MSGENETDYALTVQTVPVLEKKWHFNDNIKKFMTSISNPQLRCMLYSLTAERIIPRFTGRKDQTKQEYRFPMRDLPLFLEMKARCFWEKSNPKTSFTPTPLLKKIFLFGGNEKTAGHTLQDI